MTTRPSGSTATAPTAPSWRPSSPDRARLARRVVHQRHQARAGPGPEAAAEILCEVILGKLGRLHPQLPQDVARLVQGLGGAQVVGLADDGRKMP